MCYKHMGSNKKKEKNAIVANEKSTLVLGESNISIKIYINLKKEYKYSLSILRPSGYVLLSVLNY